MIEFRKITDDNFRQCIELHPGKENESFVDSNSIGLAEAFVAIDNDTCSPMPFAIYKDDQMVGFIQLAYYRANQDEMLEEVYDIWRFMIDEKYQGKGYGKAALRKAIEYVKTYPKGFANKLYLSYVPGNKAAESIYKRVGFVKTGEVSDGEIVMVYDLKKQTSDRL